MSSNIFDPNNKERLNIQNANSAGKENIINQNLGQYIDITYEFLLDKNSLEKTVEKQIDQNAKFNALKAEILRFLNSKDPKNQFNEGDITNYFNGFKSPYHTTKQNDKYSTVNYTSEHLSRLLSESQWTTKNPGKTYNGKKYKKRGGNTTYFIDENHFGIDLTLDNSKNELYPTQKGKIKKFPGENGGLGNVIAIQHVIDKNGAEFTLPLVTIYAHMNSIVDVDTTNSTGADVNVGTEGNTPSNFGYSEHLHLELWKVDNNFSIETATLQSIRSTNSYNYRFLNQTFLSFVDKTGYKDFFEVNENNKPANNAGNNVDDGLNVLNRQISKNIFVIGSKNISGVLDSSINIRTDNSPIPTIKYYDIAENIKTKTKRIILDNYSFKNQNVQNGQHINFLVFSNKKYITDETKLINIKLDFKSFLEKKDEYISTTTNISFGEQIKIDYKENTTPIFSFYFPLRFNIFRNNDYYNDKNDIVLKLKNNIIQDLSHYYIKFDIFDIDFNDILNVKYDKSSTSFNISKNFGLGKKQIPDGETFYSCKIVKTNERGTARTASELSFEDLKENKGVFKIFDTAKHIDLFEFTYSVFEKHRKKTLSLEIRPDSTFDERTSIRRLTVIEKDPNIEYLSFSQDEDDYEYSEYLEGIDTTINNDLSEFLKVFLNIESPASNILQRPYENNSDEEKEKITKYLDNNFSKSFRMYFKERYLSEKRAVFDEKRSELPNLIISNIYDTTFYDNPKLKNDFENSSLDIANKIVKVYTDIDLPSNYFLIDTKKDSPLKGIEAYPFVESQFFSHRISSTYLPKKLYGVNFKKFKKVSTQAVDNIKKIWYYSYQYDGENKERRETGNEDYFFKPKTDIPAHSIYKLEIDLDELYFEIIYNMINIDIYNIED
jgi:hypothetical protein